MTHGGYGFCSVVPDGWDTGIPPALGFRSQDRGGRALFVLVLIITVEPFPLEGVRSSLRFPGHTVTAVITFDNRILADRVEYVAFVTALPATVKIHRHQILNTVPV